MSKVKQENNNKTKKIDWEKLSLGLIGFIAGLMTGYAIFVVSLSNSAEQFTEELETLSETADTEASTDETEVHGISTYDYEHEVLTGDKAEKAVTDLQTIFNSLSTSNPYFMVQVGEDAYDSYIYNKHGECFAVSSDGSVAAVFLNDGRCISTDNTEGTLNVGADTSVLKTVQSVLDSYIKGVEGVSLIEMTPTEETNIENYHEYRLDLVGTEAVSYAWDMVDDSLADNVIATLRTQIESDWSPHLTYSFIISEDANITAMCYVVSDKENAEYLNWVIDGYYDLPEWKLNDEWYTIDFENATDEEIKVLTDELSTSMSELLDNYFNELNAEYEENGAVNSSETDSNTTE